MQHQILELKCGKCKKKFPYKENREECPHCYHIGSIKEEDKVTLDVSPEETLEKLKRLYDNLEHKHLEGASNVPFGCWIPKALKMKGNHYDYYKEEYISFFLTALNEFPNVLKLIEKDKV